MSEGEERSKKTSQREKMTEHTSDGTNSDNENVSSHEYSVKNKKIITLESDNDHTLQSKKSVKKENRMKRLGGGKKRIHRRIKEE